MAYKSQDIFHKFKKFPAHQGDDGYKIQVEVREDQEQVIKLQEITDLLVAAGYFRARIKGLSPFDKVVGGMTWSIESCNVDVDVDLLFQENSTIGQKISLTEKIVAVLPKMNCPHRIEPHQIQGLDFIHIFPVIQWLVKRSMEFRQEMSQFVRSYAINEFHKEFQLSNKLAVVQKQILQNVNSVSDVYKPQRYFKRKSTPPDDFKTRVQITLLEYGLRGDVKNTINNAATDEVLEEEASEQEIQSLLNSMAVATEDSDHYTNLNDEEWKQLDNHYVTLKSELQDGGAKYRSEKKIFELEPKIQILDDKCSQLLQEKILLDKNVSRVEDEIKEIQIESKNSMSILQELEESTLNDSKRIKEIEELVVISDNYRTQEIQFKEKCKQDLSKLQNLIEETKKAKTPLDEEPEINVAQEEEIDKLKILKLHIAKKNRKIMALQRRLDDVPSRTELAQYQRRFLELYSQVAAKHKETKQYYTLYNTLEDTRMYMKKELSLLNSISDNYPEAMISSSGKDEFIEQMVSIVEGVKISKSKLDRRLSEEKYNRDKLSASLHIFIEQQRRYVVSVRQLSIECRKYESLLAHLRS